MPKFPSEWVDIFFLHVKLFFLYGVKKKKVVFINNQFNKVLWDSITASFVFSLFKKKIKNILETFPSIYNKASGSGKKTKQNTTTITTKTSLHFYRR